MAIDTDPPWSLVMLIASALTWVGLVALLRTSLLTQDRRWSRKPNPAPTSSPDPWRPEP